MPENLPQSAEEMQEAAMPPEHMNAEQPDDLEALLSQLSPEELQHLASSISSEMQAPEQGADPEIAQLAQAIEENLAQHPEASVEDLPAEKEAALKFIKSASYIEGFLNEALHQGAQVKQAVDMYDHSLASTLKNLKQEKTASVKEDSSRSAYFEGMFKRAAELGFSKQETLEFLKSANVLEDAYNSVASSIPEDVKELPSKAMQALSETSPAVLAGGTAAGAGALYAINKLLKKKKTEQEAAEKVADLRAGKGLFSGTAGDLSNLWDKITSPGTLAAEAINPDTGTGLSDKFNTFRAALGNYITPTGNEFSRHLSQYVDEMPSSERLAESAKSLMQDPTVSAAGGALAGAGGLYALHKLLSKKNKPKPQDYAAY